MSDRSSIIAVACVVAALGADRGERVAVKDAARRHLCPEVTP